MAEDATETGGPTVLHRRRVLIGAGAAGLAGVLAACGDDGDTSAGPGAPGTASPDTDDQPAESGPDDAGEDDGAADDGAGDDGATGDEGGDVDGLVAAADVPVGGGVILADQEIVITQPSEGEFRAFSSQCTHQGCQVSDVSDGLIRCPCHGSRYFVEDGTVENGPAPEPLPEIEVSEQDGQIVQS
ncbi:MAG: Rieske (2Fe-2S) protein [Actinomycetota bacterium]